MGYELRSSGVAAAEPAQIALTIEGQLYGVQYNLTEVEAGWFPPCRRCGRRCWRDGTLEPADEAALTAALQAGDCALLRYHGSLPLGVIAGWMGGSWTDDNGMERGDSALCRRNWAAVCAHAGGRAVRGAG